MLKMLAASAAFAILAGSVTVAPADASAPRESYRQCVANATTYCLPGAPNNPTLPPAGSPEEEAFLICREAAMARCMTLPDAPGG